jgi:hypothetical protein
VINNIVSIDGKMAFPPVLFVHQHQYLQMNYMFSIVVVCGQYPGDYWKLFLVLGAKTCLPYVGEGEKILGKDIMKVGILRYNGYKRYILTRSSIMLFYL